MKKVAIFAIAIVFVLSAWLGAQKKEDVLAVALMTSFDFTNHPACGSSGTTNCIKSIRFYDADTKLLLSEVVATAVMTEQQSIVGMSQVSSIPRRAYAVTVYLDSVGRMKEGPPGRISEFTHASH